MRIFFGFLIWVIYRIISWTWRVTLVEPADLQQNLKAKHPVVLAHWHGDEIVLISLTRRYRIGTITSTSKDGEMMNTVIRLLGGKTSRGSSTRGSIAALKGLIRLVLQEGRNCSFAVDGPKGPIYKVKPGVFELSRLAQAPIYVSGVACNRAWKFEKSWNKTYLPKPFAKIYIGWSQTFSEINRTQNPRDPAIALYLENCLHNAKALAIKKMDTL